jgi:hypothetical protein
VLSGQPLTRDPVGLLTSIIRSRGVLVGGALLFVAFILVFGIVSDALPEGGVADTASLYVSLTLPPTSLFVFIIAGAFAPPAPFLAGALLGLFDAFLISVLYLLVPTDTVINSDIDLAPSLLSVFGIAIVVGAVVTGVVAYVAGRIIRANRPPQVEVETPSWWPGQELGSAHAPAPGMPPASSACPRCGASYATGSRFCPSCGASLPPPPSYR